MNIALLGPTGSGKGTLVQSLAARFGLHPVAPGEALRQRAASHGTALGQLTHDYVQGGQLVPDEYVDAMVEEALRPLAPSRGVVFDGFPRTLAQARFLDDLLADLGRNLDAAIYLHLPDAMIFERVSRRKPPREDDEIHILRYRLQVFRRMVAPLLNYYAASGRLALLAADSPPEELERTLERLVKTLSTGRLPELTHSDRAFVEVLQGRRPQVPALPKLSINVVLLGGPGSGKGTQASGICEAFRLPHISTGDLFREHIKTRSELGRLAKTYMDRGELVPDDITERMVEVRLAEHDADPGFVLDGFPRTVSQAEALDEMMHQRNRRLTGVIHLVVSDAEIIRRLSGRRICRDCQATYHLEFRKPRQEGVCDECGGALYQRADDAPGTIEVRLRNYRRLAKPLVEYYARQGLLAEVQGEDDPAVIRAAVLGAVKLFPAVSQA